MHYSIRIAIAAGLALGLVSCNDDNNSPSTVSKVAREEIADNTDDTAEPIQLNDLSLSTRDTNESRLPEAL
jgi:hypothetical protein